jgi:hypothetical protein
MNRLFVIILVSIGLMLAVASNPIVAADSASSTGFDLNACYAQCPCNNRGIVDHACAVCKQHCEWQSWRQRAAQAKQKVK